MVDTTAVIYNLYINVKKSEKFIKSINNVYYYP